jgi:O-antigen/teichoic acid export membrane protein
MSPLRRMAAAIAATRHVAVFRSSYALMATTVVNAALGLLFWIAAARLYSADVVGLGAGGISAMQLVATAGWVGLIFTLMRYVPVAGRMRRRLILGTYLAGVVVCVPLAIAFVVALSGPFDVTYLAANALTGGAFCLGAAAWVVFTLQDSALISLRRSGVVTVENLLYGALKLGLLVALATLDEPWVLLGVWAGSALLFVAGVNRIILRHPLMGDTADPPPHLNRRAVARFSAGHTAAAGIAIVPDYLVPLLVLHLLTPAATAAFYAAWSVSASARALSVNVTDALMVEAAYGTASFSALVRRLGRLFALELVPTVACLVVAAEPIMQLFGAGYAQEGATVLRWFGLSVIPFTIVTLALALDRTRERFADALLITSVATVTTIGLNLVLIPKQGIAGAGLAWLCGQSLAAIVALRTLRHALGSRGRRRDDRPDRGENSTGSLGEQDPQIAGERAGTVLACPTRPSVGPDERLLG